MDFEQIQNQINDLPQTFKRYDAPYTQWVDALTSALRIFGMAIDGLMDQVATFENAEDGWNDAWGALGNVVRRTNESDAVYHPRIQNTVLAEHVTPVAMLEWLEIIEMVLNPQLSENSPAVGYSITLPSTLSTSEILQIIRNLNVVRPAGVPFNVYIQTGALYLDTVNYFDAPRVTGAYLGNSNNAFPLGLSAGQNNATSILPDLLLVDPTINPGEPAL